MFRRRVRRLLTQEPAPVALSWNALNTCHKPSLAPRYEIAVFRTAAKEYRCLRSSIALLPFFSQRIRVRGEVISRR
jgi:hypothetical protein